MRGLRALATNSKQSWPCLRAVITSRRRKQTGLSSVSTSVRKRRSKWRRKWKHWQRRRIGSLKQLGSMTTTRRLADSHDRVRVVITSPLIVRTRVVATIPLPHVAERLVKLVYLNKDDLICLFRIPWYVGRWSSQPTIFLCSPGQRQTYTSFVHIDVNREGVSSTLNDCSWKRLMTFDNLICLMDLLSFWQLAMLFWNS